MKTLKRLLVGLMAVVMAFSTVMAATNLSPNTAKVVEQEKAAAVATAKADAKKEAEAEYAASPIGKAAAAFDAVTEQLPTKKTFKKGKKVNLAANLDDVPDGVKVLFRGSSKVKVTKNGLARFRKTAKKGSTYKAYADIQYGKYTIRYTIKLKVAK